MCDVVLCEYVDYYKLRVGGLVVAGLLVFFSILVLAGESTTTTKTTTATHVNLKSLIQGRV